MNRSFWKIALATAAICISSPTRYVAARQPNHAASIRRLQTEIDQLREELAAMKAQVVRLEGKPSPLSFDRDGIIRNAAGRSVGYWGVDDPRQRYAAPRR